MFELSQFLFGEACDLGIREPAENEVHLAGATMPTAKQQPFAAVIETVARSCRSSHCNSIPNAKSPDVPGEADIASAPTNVSTRSRTIRNKHEPSEKRRGCRAESRA